MKYITVIISFIILVGCKSQDVSSKNATIVNTTAPYVKPKLVVGIVVDQMRYDYLTRFYDDYGNSGFKRLLNDGFNCKNNHYNYVPTYTGPGHASIFTGTTPKYHGIIANNWYDKSIKSSVYVAGDSAVTSVGTLSDAGKMSPHRMKTTTFADENRLFTQLRGKTIGISVKDRGAILPAGHSANGAYWFHGKDEGKFITSSYYMNVLPTWVTAFNASGKAQSYLKPWETLYDITTYEESGSDLNTFEGMFKGKETATFPYDLKTLAPQNKGFDILKATPYGNSIVTDFAIAALDGEQLGQDAITDVLTVSYSSTDYVGHIFGVNSKELQDTYLRLDLEIARLLTALDAKVGAGNYSLFLTSDHGAVEVPSYLQSVKIPAGYVDGDAFKAQLNAFVTKQFGASDVIENISNNQIFLNHKRLEMLNIDLSEIEEAIVDEIISYPNVYKVYSAKTLQTTQFETGIESLLQLGYNQKRSGDVILVHDPAVISYSKTGSTHGSALNYDTHVPLLFFGKGFTSGSTLQKTEIIDIAPTISALLGISFPNGAIGQPLEFVLED